MHPLKLHGRSCLHANAAGLALPGLPHGLCDVRCTSDVVSSMYCTVASRRDVCFMGKGGMLLSDGLWIITCKLCVCLGLLPNHSNLVVVLL